MERRSIKGQIGQQKAVQNMAANMPVKWAVTNIVWALTVAARQISSSVWVQLVNSCNDHMENVWLLLHSATCCMT